MVHWKARAGLGLCLLAGLLMIGSPVRAQQLPKPEVFTALAASAEGPTAPVTITIRGYSTQQQAEAAAATLRSAGPDATVKLLDKTDLGRIARSGQLGVEINLIRSHPTPTGRIITMVLARHITFFEATQGTRSRDYPFGVIVLNVDAQGQGTGNLVPAAKIKFTDLDTVEVESYTNTPVRLMSVRQR